MNPNWNKVNEIALDAHQKLGELDKPGSRFATILATSWQEAMKLGYLGTEYQWHEFIRNRAKAFHSKKRNPASQL